MNNRYAHVVDHKMHDGLGHEVPYGFVYNANVRIHQVADGFHLPLQLRVHRECVCRDIFILRLVKRHRINPTSTVNYSQRGQPKHLFISYLVLLWINPSPKEGCFPAVHIFLRITGQFYLTEIFINVPVHIQERQTDEFVSLLNACSANS